MSTAAILVAILDFENFIETLRTIERNKETIVTRPNKVMCPASGLSVWLRVNEAVLADEV